MHAIAHKLPVTVSMTSRQDEYLDLVVAHYGMLLSVGDVARLFKYKDPEAVRKAHRAGTLPVSLKAFPDRRGLFVTAFEAANAIRRFDQEMNAGEEQTCFSEQ